MPVAIITGGDSGIGRAGAVILAERGWDVGITYRSDEDGAREVAQEVEQHGRRCEVRRLDLVETDTIAQTVQDLADALGGLDCFVNNAGTGASSPFLEHSLDDWREVLETDLTGAFVAAQRAAQVMVDQGTRPHPPRIINITSVHEHIPLKGSSAYCAAKGGLGLLTKVMAVELAEHGITVNSIAPGEISTPMTGQHHEDPADNPRKWIPAGRPGHAREIGEWIAFLASGGAQYATGGSYVVDGGLTLMGAVANQTDPG
jgi:NAD(P)-dependent dehydrogenase (short-subunit alcohol dehydrogenase family)